MNFCNLIGLLAGNMSLYCLPKRAIRYFAIVKGCDNYIP